MWAFSFSFSLFPFNVIGGIGTKVWDLGMHIIKEMSYQRLTGSQEVFSQIMCISTIFVSTYGSICSNVNGFPTETIFN